MNAAETLELVRLRRLMKSGQAKLIREEAGLSVRSAADAAEVSPAALWRWEASERVPTGDPALRYAGFLRRIARSARSAS